MSVFDASAMLALLFQEPGSELVEQRLPQGGACGAANWAEVAQKCRARGKNWFEARQALLSFPLTIEPVTAADAELAAEMWHRGEGLSLADRLCLALGIRLGAEVLSADQAWAGREGVIVIR